MQNMISDGKIHLLPHLQTIRECRQWASLGTGAPAPANVTYSAATVTLTAAMCTKYGIDASHVGEKIYPYVDVNARNGSDECYLAIHS